MKLGNLKFVLGMLASVAYLPLNSWAQVNSGSNGSDGAFTPTATNTVINMADHPTGIYQFTAVNIPAYVTVTFLPNPNNTPVVWLVQSNVVINGMVDVRGQGAMNGVGGLGGPGGWPGGSGGSSQTPGRGPGGGGTGGPASYGTLGNNYSQYCARGIPGVMYGNSFVLPLLGGSGGGGGGAYGGGGGGGAILIASSSIIQVNGTIVAFAGVGGGLGDGGCGSGGAIRLVTSTITGNGQITAAGASWCGGDGRVRFDTLQNAFGGQIGGTFTAGSQFIILPTPGQGAQLTVTSVAGVPVSAAPTGGLATPDAVLSAQQANPVAIVVSCANLPLNTPITVTVKPATGAAVSGIGYNNSGTTNASTATVLINMPRGGGIIYANAATAP